jgi:hypothetical protein
MKKVLVISIFALGSMVSFEDNAKVAFQGGNVAKVARLELEQKTGKKVVTSVNAKTSLKGKDVKQIDEK